MGEGMITGGGLRLEVDGGLRFANRAGSILGVNESAGKSNVRFGKRRIELNRFLQFGDRCRNFALGEQDPTQQIVSISILRVRLDRRFEGFLCGGEVALANRVKAFDIRMIGGGGSRSGCR